MYRRGIVEELDATKHRARVRFPDRQNVVSGWLDVLVRETHEDKEYSMPAKGTQVAVMMDDKDEDGCILGAVYSEVDAPTATSEKIRRWNFADGGLVEYDRTTHVLRVSIPDGGKLELAGNAEPIALGDKTKAEFDKIKTELDALKQSLNTHTHPTAAPGSPTGPGTPPHASSYTAGAVGASKARSA
jgi:phage baseplate assembly protein V